MNEDLLRMAELIRDSKELIFGDEVLFYAVLPQNLLFDETFGNLEGLEGRKNFEERDEK